MSTQQVVLPDENEMDIPGEDPMQEQKIGHLIEKGPQNRFVDRSLAVVVTFAPPIATVLAIYGHFVGWYSITWIEISLLVLMHTLAVAGVELGFHRFFAHKSFKANRGVKIALAALGSMGFQGPVIWWAAVHRKHHRYSDRPNDPHSIYIKPDGREEYNKGFWQLFLGFVHSHVGWIWTPHSIRFEGWNRYVRDLYKDKDIWTIHVNYLYFLLAGFLIPAVLGGILHGSWQGAFTGMLWGGFVRIFTMNHLSYWSINTLSHSVGSRPFKTADRSTNSIPIIFAIPTFGQSYHNNHHAFPGSAQMAYRWYELDVGYWVLRTLKSFGWVTDMGCPSVEKRQRKKN